MLSSVPSLRLLLSLLVIFVATVYTVTANDGEKSKTPANTHSARDSDEKDAKTEAAPEKNKGDKAEPNHADENAPTVKSQIIQLAPEVELLNNGDISVKGDCKGDINTFCAHVKAGSSHLAECLQNRIEDEEEGSAELLGTVSKECKEEVIGYKMNLAKNINYDTAMANACKADAEEHCKDLNDITVDGKVITCLREMKPSLSAKCRDHITRAQLEAARDYRIDAAVYESCKMDAYKFCKGVEAGSGRVNACLRSHRDEVRPSCILPAEIIRLVLSSLVLMSAAAALPQGIVSWLLHGVNCPSRSESKQAAQSRQPLCLHESCHTLNWIASP